MDPSPSIAIIGAGPSGLVFARLLQVHGITDYVVFERDPSSTPGPWQQGGSLDLHGPSGQAALKKARLFDAFNSVYARWDASRVHIVNQTGETVTRFGEGRDAPEIDRLQLRQLLLDSVDASKIRWNHEVRSVEREDSKSSGSRENCCTIHFTNGSSVTGCRLIVGADGVWSKLRPLLTPAKPVYAGKMYIEGKISHNNPSYSTAKETAGPGTMLAVGQQKQMAVQQIADGTYRVYFGLKVPETFYHHRSGSAVYKTEAIRQMLLSLDDFYATWAPHLKAIIANAEGPFRAWPLYRMELDDVGWKRVAAPGMTLLGDAAHVSTPFVGEGVNCSMYDAVVLAERIFEQCGGASSLANVPAARLEKALASYEQDMFERGRDLIRRSMESEGMIFAGNAAELLLQAISGANGA
ncbi:tetracycline resistance protein from transposon Tn4351/Tn4400 [Aspergillus udagawae]|nr:tetracycline resistance protein from transposon Tn4351/Tn4400 [Aspergillus udagawae]